MNRAFSPLLYSVFAAFLAVASTAHAADDKKAPVKADPAKGEALYTNGDSARNIVACVSCHGAAGNSTITQNPKLAGQHEAYIAKQLLNFRTPDRNNPVMSPMAKALSDEDIHNVAAFLAAQAPKPGAAKNKDTIDLGKHIWRAGIAAKNVPACAGCHSPNGPAIPAQYPRLAGEPPD